MWRVWFFIIILIFGIYVCYLEYQAVKKFYPRLTFSDYLILEDRLYIIPVGEDERSYDE
jgi:hypothetical protein